MKAENYAAVEFLSRSSNEGFARMVAAAFAAQLDPTLDELGDIKTAVSEAVTNAIVHGYADRLGTININGRLYPDGKLVLKIKDRGRGIEDIAQAMEPLFTTGNAEERSGMGFTVMEAFMDKVKVTSKTGMGTTVTLTKYIKAKD